MTRILSSLFAFLLVTDSSMAQFAPRTSDQLQAERVASAKASLERALPVIKPFANSLARQEDKARIADEVLPLLKSADQQLTLFGIGRPPHPAQHTIRLAIKDVPSASDRILNKKWSWDTRKTRDMIEQAIKEFDPTKAQPK